MVTTRTPSPQRVVLRNISWQTFETILAEMGEDRTSRLYYDQGILEIERLIFVLGEELNLEIFSAGFTTLKRKDLLQGAEPDSSYYIQNKAWVRNKSEIDLNCDPPPDLVVENNLTSSSLDKLQIYASLGVPELWVMKKVC